uniref:Kynurenine--oxoglutarate transaminase 1 n=1 Tax=Ursus maritimus TaxID=29073 RepID=A0A452V4F7_URSMA
MFRNVAAIYLHLAGLLQRKKAGTSLTRCLHQTFAMAKRLQARRLDGIDHNPWVEFSRMASEYDVVNLGQGFPDFPPPDFAVQAFQLALSSDYMLNQYTKAFGYPPLTEILASFFGKLLGQEIDPLKNVLVTVGAYGALFTAFQALVDEGDEVIIIEPFFDCYEPMTLMAGGRPVFVTLKLSPTQDGELDSASNWQLDPTELASKFTSRTKALVLNTPNNPLGKVFSEAELELVASLCQQHDVICISDEVYQWLVYDGHQHISIASLPGMWEPTLTIGSAGKSFSATGWKVGWALGPDRLLKHLRTVHQNTIYHCPTQGQVLQEANLPCPAHRGKLSVPQRQGLPCCGVALTRGLPPPQGLAAIPASIFYSMPHRKHFDHYVRFCFVKDESTLQAMDEKLQRWKTELRP